MGRSGKLSGGRHVFLRVRLTDFGKEDGSGEPSGRRDQHGVNHNTVDMYCSRRCVRTALRVAEKTHRQELRLPALPVRALRTSPACPFAAILVPPLDGAPKQYSPKIHNLVNGITGLTLLEVSDLNELLKKTFNVQDVGVMPGGATIAAPSVQVAEEDEAPVKKGKTHFTVKLTELKAAEKIKLIKEVKNCIQGLNLVQAKKLVESLPKEIRANVSKEEAEQLRAALEAAGGTVVLE